MQTKALIIFAIALAGVLFSLYMVYSVNKPDKPKQPKEFLEGFIHTLFDTYRQGKSPSDNSGPYSAARSLLSYDSRSDKHLKLHIQEGRVILIEDGYQSVIWSIHSLDQEVIWLFKRFISKHRTSYNNNDYYIRVYRSAGYVHIEFSFGGDVMIFSDEESYLYHTDTFEDDHGQGIGGALVNNYSHFIEYGKTYTCFNQKRLYDTTGEVFMSIEWITSPITKETTASSKPLHQHIAELNNV